MWPKLRAKMVPPATFKGKWQAFHASATPIHQLRTHFLRRMAALEAAKIAKSLKPAPDQGPAGKSAQEWLVTEDFAHRQAGTSCRRPQPTVLAPVRATFLGRLKCHLLENHPEHHAKHLKGLKEGSCRALTALRVAERMGRVKIHRAEDVLSKRQPLKGLGSQSSAEFHLWINLMALPSTCFTPVLKGKRIFRSCTSSVSARRMRSTEPSER